MLQDRDSCKCHSGQQVYPWIFLPPDTLRGPPLDYGVPPDTPDPLSYLIIFLFGY